MIGPFAYLRSSVIGNGAVIRERSTLTMSFVGGGAFVMGCDVANSYIGPETAIFAPALYNVVFGERGLLGGSGGFADFLVGSGAIVANIAGTKVQSNLTFLGSAVGDDCFVGTNMIFAPGQTIPDGTKVFDHGLVKFTPTTSGGNYVVAGSDVIQVPDIFMGSARHESRTTGDGTRQTAPRLWRAIDMLWESISKSVVDQRLSTQPAIVSDEAELTYGELLACSDALAHALREIGVGPGHVVLTSLDNVPAFLVAVLASARLVRRSRRSTLGRRPPRSRASSH